jgi:hypothetical protein
MMAQALLVRRLEFDRRIRAVAKGLVLRATTTCRHAYKRGRQVARGFRLVFACLIPIWRLGLAPSVCIRWIFNPVGVFLPTLVSTAIFGTPASVERGRGVP